MTISNEGEEAISEFGERFFATLLNSPNAIVVVDEAGRMVMINSALEKLSGYSHEEMVDQPVELLVPEELRHVHIELRKQYVSEPQARRMGPGRELLLRRRDGSFTPVEVELSPIFVIDDGVRIVAIISDINPRKLLEAAIRRQRDELELQVQQNAVQIEARDERLTQLTSALNTAEQRERQRIAELLHDHVQQLLVAAKLRLDHLSPRIDPQRRPILEGTSGLLKQSIDALRTLSIEMAPPVLREAGLAAGLEWLAQFMNEKHGITVHLHLDQHAANESENTRLILFQCVRELLFNAVKHANVREVTVEQSQPDDDTLQLTVSDAGKGFDVETVLKAEAGNQSWGLFSIRERLTFLGGRMDIDSAPGRGASFTLIAPLR